MSNSISHARLPYPILNARYTLEYVGLDADGDPTDPTTPDTEVSQDGGAFADAAEEVSTISGSNGCGYITLTGAETNNSLVMVCAKVASGPKATVFSLRPRNLAIVGSGTLSAGSAGGGTLGTLLAYDVTGCFIRTTGGTGGGGTGGANNQARRIITYNTTTGAFTVSPNWETTPSTDTTYDVLLPEGVTLGMLKALNPATAGRTLVIDSAGLADANMVKLGPSGSGVATTAALCTNLKLAYDTDFSTLYDTTNKAFLSKLANAAMGGSSLVLSIGSFSNAGAWTQTGAVTATNASNDIRGILLQAAQTGVTIPTVTNLTNLPAITANWLTSAGIAPSAISAIQSGLATASALSTVQADTDDIQTRLPAALVSGRMDSSVGAIASGVDFSSTQKTSIAASVWNAAMGSYQTSGSMGLSVNELDVIYQNAYDGITARMLSNVTHISSSTPASQIRSAVGLASANLDTQLSAISAKTGNLPSDPADASDIAAALATLTSHGDSTWATATGFAVAGDAMALTSAERNNVAAVTLRRSMANVEAAAVGDTLNKSSLYGSIQQMQYSNTTDSAGLLTIKKTGGATLGTLTLATASSVDQITGISP